MKITVAGIGPGGDMFITPQARKAIEDCDVVVGYDLYAALIKHLTEGKEVVTTGMKREVGRCQAAVELAKSGKRVTLVCGGDAGIYGMAGLLFETAKGTDIEIEVVPGVTAATAAAAVLGAPITHDFAVVSLSDLLTPWEKIEKRLALASQADFVICLYNPRSHSRPNHLARAALIMLDHKAPGTPCGCVKNAGRDGESFAICTLDELASQDVDMFTTVIIGNSQTNVIDGRLVTPRGYKGV